MIKEEWRQVVGYEGLYEISTNGRLRRVGRDQLGRLRYVGHICSPALSRGYLKYLLHKNSTKKNALAHVLVAEAFIGPRPENHHINHKDGNKANPWLGNLEYVTRSGNHRHALENGLFVPPSGLHHWSVILDDEKVREIRRRALAGERHKDLAAEFNCSMATISRYRNAVGRASQICS